MVLSDYTFGKKLFWRRAWRVAEEEREKKREC
jgi:hypothetical protein